MPMTCAAARIGLGRACYRLGRLEEAVRHLRGAEALAGEISNPQRLADARSALAEAGEGPWPAAWRPHRPAGRSSLLAGRRAEQQGDRRGTVPQPGNRGAAPRHHLPQARPERTGRGHPLCRDAGTGRPDTLTAGVITLRASRPVRRASPPAYSLRNRIFSATARKRAARWAASSQCPLPDRLHACVDSPPAPGAIDLRAWSRRPAHRGAQDAGSPARAASGTGGSGMRDQLLGTTLPVLSILLEPGESVVAEAGEFCWMTDSIQMTTDPGPAACLRPGAAAGHAAGHAAGAASDPPSRLTATPPPERCSAPTRRRAQPEPSRSRRPCRAASCRSTSPRAGSTWCTGTGSWPERPALARRRVSGSRSPPGSSPARASSCGASAAMAAPGCSWPERPSGSSWRRAGHCACTRRTSGSSVINRPPDGAGRGHREPVFRRCPSLCRPVRAGNGLAPVHALAGPGQLAAPLPRQRPRPCSPRRPASRGALLARSPR